MTRMRAIALLSLVPVLLLSAGTGGCKDSTTTPGDEIVFPAANVSYMQSVQPYFDMRCAVGGCHDDGTRAGNLSLTSYVNTTARPGIVVPFNATTSLLMQKIDGRLPHPPNVPILINQNQLDGIATWINEGAKNN